MLCQNRVADFPKWKAVFDTHAQAHRVVGLRMRDLCCDLEELNNVFLMFEVHSLDKPRALVSDPAAAEAG